MKLTIEDGRDSFYTFDTNRILLLTATDEEQINQVEFSTEENGETVSWTSDVLTGENGIKYVQVPNEFLNGDYSRLVCYYVALDSNGEYTRQKEVFRIRARQEPQDYYLTYSERVTFASIKALTEQYKVNASNSADLARRYAEEDEDVNVEAGTYSSKHWSAKSEKKFQEIKDYVGSTSDPESAIGSIESARASAVSDVNKQKTDSIEAIGTYTSNTAIPSISQYVESTAKPALKTYGEQQVNSYVNGTSKPELDRYVNNEKKQVLDNYTSEKKSELNNYTETDKKQILDSYTENEKKAELDSHTEGLKEQLNAHTVAKTGELNEYTTGLKSELDGYITTKEQDISEFTEQKKLEVQGVYQTDLDELKGDLDNLPLPIVRTNLFDGIYERIIGKDWIRGAVDLATTDNSDNDIVSVKVEAGKSYTIKAIASYARSTCRFADINNTLVSDLSLVGEFNKAFTMPANVVTLYIAVPTGYNPVVAESEAFPYNEDFDYFVKNSTTIPRVERNINRNTSLIDSILEDSINLADASKFTLGKYMTNTGAINANSSYFYTDYIPVEPNDIIFVSNAPRWTCCFDENGNVVENSSNADPSGWTVPNNVCSIVLTGYINDIDNFVVSKGSLIPYTPYQKRINYDLVSMYNVGNVYGRNGLTKNESSLSANTAIEFNEFPKSLMKGTSITGIVYFSEFDSITFGVGNSSGIYFVIDSSTIKTYSDSTLIDTKNHNLTISKYLSFSLMVKDDIMAYVTIDSVGGSFSMDISVSYNFYGFPFFKSTNDSMDVKVSVTNNDFKKSVWWFGDSYSGWAEYRVLGQLKLLGVTDGMLIDAVPGQRSYYSADTGAYVDFSKAIAFGLPKYLVWAIGMNDTTDIYKTYIYRIAKFCELMHIELIVVKPPIVPSVDNSEINAFIDSKGFRFIDWNKAVGANSSGVWYTGMLSTDNVHPNETGAKALAMRTVTDFVEITQYR